MTSYDEFLWERVAIGDIDECWLWRLGTTKGGYGLFSKKINGHWRKVYAHRRAYQEVYGTLASNLNACHRCDEPLCCNPLHMFAGTWSENMEDMRAKGRVARGERRGSRTHPECVPRGEGHYRAKLTHEQARAIRVERAAGEKLLVIGARYGIGTVTVFDIVHGKTWKEATDGSHC